MCGEKSYVCRGLNRRVGSPPRVRGKVRQGVQRVQPHGITPACAGKSFQRPHGGFCEWDHPRVCGEKYYAAHREEIAEGSPPRVRGKDLCHRGVHLVAGITPACAGKSALCLFQLALKRDHPRVCGEKVFRFSVGKRLRGSPPRVRGKVPFRLRARPPSGITPACAGKRLKKP